MYNNKRVAHILRPNEGSQFPEHIIFFDTETIENKLGQEIQLELLLGSATYWVYRKDRVERLESIDFKTKKEFWDFVFSKIQDRKKLYIVAHNIAFDFRVMQGFKELVERKYKTYKIINAGTRNIWIFKNGTSTICCLDNMNFFNSSLEYLGHSIGLEKLKVKFEKSNDNLEELIIYCRRDVEIMVKAWQMLFKFLIDNDLGHFSKTIASQAFNAYRHRFMKSKIYIHNNNEAIRYERNSYHGGRTEIFKQGKFPVDDYFMLDVNSMYPSVMRDNEYPKKLLGSEINPTLKRLKYLLKHNGLIADLELKTDKPVFGYKDRDKKLIFPIGRFSTVITTREIKYALENNMIIKIHKLYKYKMKNLFKEYVDFFYTKKVEFKDSNPAFYYMVKLFLNSLYGKFGQRNEQWTKEDRGYLKEDGIMSFFDLDNEKRYKERRIGGRIEKSTGEKFEGYESFVAIPAHITADARLILWEIIELAGRENVYYCDTDSIITNKTGYNKCKHLINPDKLGSLSIKEQGQDLEIWSVKDYIFNKKQVIKGIKKDAKNLGNGKFSQMRFEGFAGALKKSRLDKMIITPITKQMKRNYTKGNISNKGIVTPFLIKESQRLF